MVDPVIAGAVVRVGAWVEAVVTADHRLVEPMVLVWVVLAVMNLPASADVCVYVAEVAPLIAEHWEGRVEVAVATALVHRYH